VALRFLGVDPSSPGGDSPSLFYDDVDDSYVIQGWRVDEATMTEVLAIGEVPPHETVVRLPRRMVRFFLDSNGEEQG